MNANNFAEHKPCVILYVEDPKNPQALCDENNEVLVFERYTKARKHVANRIEPKYHPFLHYVNEEPEIGAGDREATNNRRCLNCNSFLRPSGNDSRSRLPSGDIVAVETFDCPKCHLGEK